MKTNLAELFGAPREFRKSVRRDYKHRMGNFKRDADLLWRETPGQSMFDSLSYATLVAGCYPYITDTEEGKIDPRKRSILGDEFLEKYFGEIERFKEGMRRYHPDLI